MYALELSLKYEGHFACYHNALKLKFIYVGVGERVPAAAYSRTMSCRRNHANRAWTLDSFMMQPNQRVLRYKVPRPLPRPLYNIHIRITLSDP